MSETLLVTVLLVTVLLVTAEAITTQVLGVTRHVFVKIGKASCEF